MLLILCIFAFALKVSALQVFECGKRQIDTSPLVVGGYATQHGEWPWHAGIFHKEGARNEYKCGGVLIGDLWVLTAAHCVTDPDTFEALPADLVLTQFGQYDLTTASRDAQNRDVYSIHVHEGYEEQPHLNDIALLFLKKEVEFTTYVQPACISYIDISRFTGESGTLVGWGYTGFDAQKSDLLRAANLPIIDNIQCVRSNPTYGRLLAEGMFCAGLLNGTSACNGDSGGGLYLKIEDIWHVIGLVSFTVVTVTPNDVKICSPDDYAAFTDIKFFKEWIYQTQLDHDIGISRKNAEANIIRWLEFWRKQIVCDSVKGEGLEFEGEAHKGVKLWLFFDKVEVKNLEKFVIEDITVKTLDNTSVTINYAFHIDKVIVEGKNVKGKLMDLIDFRKSGEYVGNLYGVKINGSAEMQVLEDGTLVLKKLKINMLADDISTNLENVMDKRFWKSLYQSALSNVLSKVLEKNQQRISDATERYFIRRSSNRENVLTLNKFIRPPPKLNAYFEDPCNIEH